MKVDIVRTSVVYRHQGRVRTYIAAAGMQRPPENTIQRYIIRPERHIPFTWQIRSFLIEAVRRNCRSEHHDLFSLARNNQGDFLVDAPVVSGTDNALKEFAEKVATLGDKRLAAD